MANDHDDKKAPVNGDLFDCRLKKKGLTHKELATLSGVSVRKISDCVAGKPAKPSILKAIAPHLDLSYDEITGAIPEQTAPPAPHKSVIVTHNADGTVTVQIVFAKSCKPPLKPHARKYLGAIITLLGLEGGFDDDDLLALTGSLVVTVPLSRRDAAKLVNAFIAGELQQFDIVSVAVANHAAIPEVPIETAIAPITTHTEGGTRRLPRHRLKMLVAYLPSDLVDRVKRGATARNTSVSLFIRHALIKMFAKPNDPDKLLK
jgi:hypothetical protein